jgi:hypothetical protein
VNAWASAKLVQIGTKSGGDLTYSNNYEQRVYTPIGTGK